MFDVGQKVIVVTDKGISYDGVIQARATGDDGQGAYKIALDGSGPGQMGQWHKAGDVFLREITNDEAQDSWESSTES